MKYCTKCGAEITEDSKFCVKCGNEVNMDSAGNESGKTRKIVPIVIVISVILVAGYLNYTGGKSDNNAAVETSADTDELTYEISDEDVYGAEDIFTDTEESTEMSGDAHGTQKEEETVSSPEAAVKMLLEAEGFTDVTVSVTDNYADVVLNMGEVTDAKRALVEDIVKQKTNVEPQNIVITPISGAEDADGAANKIGRKSDRDIRKDLTYTILEENEIPQEFLSVIDEKKEQAFKLTYTDGENLYIAVGYGVQPTGGYSISVNQCYLTSNAIYFDATLIEPSKGEPVNEAKSYPYLVIKTEYSERVVVFE